MKNKERDDSCSNSESRSDTGDEKNATDKSRPDKSVQETLSKRLLDKLRRLKEEDPDIYPLF